MAVNILDVNRTMRKLILLDILSVLALIQKYQTNDEIEGCIINALTDGLLDEKAVKQVELMLH